MWRSDLLRSNNFDFFRLAMATLVIYSHTFPLLYGSNQGIEPLARVTGGQLTFGALAVDVFFIISGFLITMSWQHSRGTFDFLKRRLRRIAPAYLCAMLLMA